MVLDSFIAFLNLKNSTLSRFLFYLFSLRIVEHAVLPIVLMIAVVYKYFKILVILLKKIQSKGRKITAGFLRGKDFFVKKGAMFEEEVEVGV
jgi:hypothetical protein